MHYNLFITESAEKHFKNALAYLGKQSFLRIGIKPSGCSGYSYVTDIIDNINYMHETDIQLKVMGITCVINKDQIKYFEGTTIDYVQQGFDYTVKFINPNVKNECGCGESIQFKELNTN